MACITKFFLFVLNFAVFAIGIIVVALASVIIANGSSFNLLLSEGTFTMPVVVLIFGLAVVLLGFFGCCGALRESPCLLYTYAAVVLVLFVAQLAAAVYMVVQKDVVLDALADGMTKNFKKYGGNDTEYTSEIDTIQNDMKCCGVYNYTDWYNEDSIGLYDDAMVPVGCCLNITIDGCNLHLDDGTDPAKRIYITGCFTTMIEAVEGEALWLGIGAIVLALVQLACVTIACGIGKKASREHTVY